MSEAPESVTLPTNSVTINPLAEQSLVELVLAAAPPAAESPAAESPAAEPPAAEPPVAVPEPTAGQLLRAAREAAGLHIASLAVSLKVPVKKLEALEADRYEHFSDPVFLRGLAGAVCRALRTDPHPILRLLPQTVKPNLEPEPGINAPFQSSGHHPASGTPSGLTQPLAWVVLSLLLGAAVIHFLPEIKLWVATLGPQEHESSPATPTLVANVPAVVVEPASSASALSSPGAQLVLQDVPLPVFASATVAANVAVAASAAPAASSSTSVATRVPAALPLPSPQASRAPSSPAVASAASASAGKPSLLVLNAKRDTWVEVQDRAGNSVLRRTLATGESVPIAAPTPLQVVIGRADAVAVQLRGQAFDLTPYSKGNIAHFEVK